MAMSRPSLLPFVLIVDADLILVPDVVRRVAPLTILGGFLIFSNSTRCGNPFFLLFVPDNYGPH
jgi:hypothetical protein